MLLPTLRRITTERDLHSWLHDRGRGDGGDHDLTRRASDLIRHGTQFHDGGVSCLAKLQRWSSAHRYIVVAFQDGRIRFTDLPGCVDEFGVCIDVSIEDRHRLDLQAIAHGHL